MKKKKKSPSPPPPPPLEIQHFRLEILPENQLALNPNLGTLAVLAIGQRGPEIVQQTQFAQTELRLVIPLLESGEVYTPYEILYASFNSTASEENIELARSELLDAQDEGTWTEKMRPLRNVLSRARLKLREIGLDIKSIHDMGYILELAQNG